MRRSVQAGILALSTVLFVGCGSGEPEGGTDAATEEEAMLDTTSAEVDTAAVGMRLDTTGTATTGTAPAVVPDDGE